METLPLELLRHYIVANYRICGTLRRTCKRYARITFVSRVVWTTMLGIEINEHTDYRGSALCLIQDGIEVHEPSPLVWRSQFYRLLCDYTGVEYTMWLCSRNKKEIAAEIDKIAAAGYDHRVVVNVSTAVYIKTTELNANVYVPSIGYHDMLW